MRGLSIGLVLCAALAAAAPEVLPPTAETMVEFQKIEAAGYHPGAIDDLRLKYQDRARQNPAATMPRVFVAWCTLPSDDAWNQLKAISTIYPDNPWVRYGMGRIYTGWKGMSDLAKAEFDAVLKRDPKFFPALVGLGDVAMVKGDFALAEERYRAALAIHDDAFAHSGLGLALAAQAKNDAARAELKKALAMHPELPKAIAALVKLSSDAQDPDTVIAAQALADLRPKDPDARRTLAELRFARGEKELAVKEYERLARLTSLDLATWQRIAGLYRELHDVDSLERTLTTLASMDEKSTTYNFELAELKLAKKDLEGAEGQWLEVIARDPKAVQARERIAKLRLEQGSKHLALEEYRLAAAMDPSRADIAAEVERFTKEFKLPKKMPKGGVNNVYWAVQWSLGRFFEEKKKTAPGLAGAFKLKVRVNADGKAIGLEVVEDTLKDPDLLAHAWFCLADAEYPRQKVEPTFEFELGVDKKKKGK